MNVERGTFQTIKPPNIYGNSRYLTKDTNYIISFDANIGKNKTIPLPGLINDSYYNNSGEMPETPADINYRLIETTLGFQFYRVIKDPYHYTGLGGGVQNFPYGFVMLGYNGKFIEVGGVAFGGFALNEASYGGMGKPSCGRPPGGFRVLAKCSYEYFQVKNMNVLHTYAGIVAHASFHWNKFALNYASSVSNPWFVGTLPAVENENDFSNGDITFSFPVLLMQDIGISYAPNSIKYRLGVNQITGVKFPGQYWGLSVQVAYGW
jgi:hypothetical protein